MAEGYINLAPEDVSSKLTISQGITADRKLVYIMDNVVNIDIHISNTGIQNGTIIGTLDSSILPICKRVLGNIADYGTGGALNSTIWINKDTSAITYYGNTTTSQVLISVTYIRI